MVTEPTTDEIEAATQELLAEGVAYDVKFLDRADAMVQSCKLGELALERARRRNIERELGKTQHALEDQARQVGAMITTAVNNATSMQQMQIAEISQHASELQARIDTAIAVFNRPFVDGRDRLALDMAIALTGGDEQADDDLVVSDEPRDADGNEQRFETRWPLKDNDNGQG